MAGQPWKEIGFVASMEENQVSTATMGIIKSDFWCPWNNPNKFAN
jgi:hypothetical protein